MIPISEYRHGSTAERLLDVPVLLVGLHEGEASASNEFRTSTHPAVFRVPKVGDALAKDGTCVVPLRKSDRNPYQNFLFVGRASTCDVILRDASVSKAHAVFEREAATGAWLLRDNRSHNGTWVDGVRIARGARVTVASGAVIVFGAYPAYLLMPDELRRILEGIAPTGA